MTLGWVQWGSFMLWIVNSESVGEPLLRHLDLCCCLTLRPLAEEKSNVAGCGEAAHTKHEHPKANLTLLHRVPLLIGVKHVPGRIDQCRERDNIPLELLNGLGPWACGPASSRWRQNLETTVVQ